MDEITYGDMVKTGKYLFYDGSWFVRAPLTFVFKGMEDDCNEAYCDEHGIPIVRMRREGGTIVMSPGDFGFIGPRKGDIPSIINNLRLYLIMRGYDPVIDRNDLMVNGGKVASFAHVTGDNGRECDASVLTLHADLMTISQVCVKPMSKVPKGLSELGVTSQDILRMISVE